MICDAPTRVAHEPPCVPAGEIARQENKSAYRPFGDQRARRSSKANPRNAQDRHTSASAAWLLGRRSTRSELLKTLQRAAVLAFAAAFGRFATTLAFAGVLSFATVVTGFAATLAFAFVLTFAPVLTFLVIRHVCMETPTLELVLAA